MPQRNVSFYYQLLDTKRRENYNLIVDAIRKRKRQINIQDVDELELFNHVLGDYPELYYAGNTFEIEISAFGKKMVFHYVYSKMEIQKNAQLIRRVIEEFHSKHIRSSQTVYEKLLEIHNFLTNEVVYDQQAFLDRGDGRYRDSYNAVGALLKKRCVCSGYAAAVKMLCDSLKIECEVVNGTADNGIDNAAHAWNIVRINNQYQHIDVTWDIQNRMKGEVSFPNYFYFSVDDLSIQKNHFWNRAMYPRCPKASYSYFEYNNMAVKNRRQLLRLLIDALEFQEKEICFQVCYVIESTDAEQDYVEKAFKEAIGKCRFIIVRGYHYFYISNHRVYLFQPTYS